MSRFGALALTIFGSISTADAGEFRILHAEPIAAHAADITAQQDSDGKSRLSFQAYGQQFDLELESNRRLLAGLASRQKAELDQYSVYRGSVSGRSGSWVRLTRIGEELHGAFWDGVDLYTVAPARAVEPFALQTLNASASDPVVYRFADVESPFDAGFCAVGPMQQLHAAAAYETLVAELREQLASVPLPSGQIELAVIADPQFRNLFPFNTQGELLAIINIVDGIFSGQVGVTIVVPEFRVLTDDPFATNDPEQLLNAVATYREATPEVRDRGLAHLMTGRDLEGETLGIAFVDSLCEPFGGVGLSEGNRGASFSALIAAHEIGHNFGARHDAEPGSGCESTPPNFLMAARVNGSSQFSQCSLDAVRPRVQAAACITPAQVADASVRVTPMPVRGTALQSFTIPIEVASLGSIDSNDVVVTTDIPLGIIFESATVPGGTCSSASGRVRCELGTLAVSSPRRIDVIMRTNQMGNYQSNVSVASSNDRNRDNDQLVVPIVVDAEADASIAVSPTPLTGFTRQPIDFSVTIRSAGPQSVTGVQATVAASGFGFASPLQVVSVTGGSCTPSAAGVDCAFSPIPAGEFRVVNLRVVPTRPGSVNASARVTAANDGNATNDAVFFGFSIAASIDASIEFVPQTLTAAINVPFAFSAVVHSLGPQPVENVTAAFSASPGDVLESATTPNGTCVATANGFTCSFGTLAPGTERPVELRARATHLGSANFSGNLDATEDDQSGNDFRSLSVTVRESVDVRLSGSFSFSVYETRSGFFSFGFDSPGVNPAPDIVATAAIPAGLSILAAQMSNGGACAITGNAVRCTLASLPPNQFAAVTLSLRGDQVGSYVADLSVTASGDADPSNNTSSRPIVVVPFTDVRLDGLPQDRQLLLDEVWELPLTVRTGVQPVNDVALDVFMSGVSFESVTSTAGSCGISQGRVFCQMATLPAQAAAIVTIRARAAVAGGFSSSARVSAPTDADPGNNSLSGSILIDERGDATLEADAPTFTGTFGQQLQYGLRVLAVGPQRVSDVRVNVSLPVGLSLDTITSEGASCTPGANSVSCAVVDLSGGNAPRIRLLVRAQNSGTFQSTATLSARNDVNAQNNSATMTLVFNAPAPPPTSGGGGDGGGGALGLLLLAVLLALALLPARPGGRRRRCCTASTTIFSFS